MRDVWNNFKLVLMWGGITYSLIVLFIVYVHYKFTFDKENTTSLPYLGLVMLLNWWAYMLTLISVRFRHAGKVCAGDYLPARLTFFENKPPYLHK